MIGNTSEIDPLTIIYSRLTKLEEEIAALKQFQAGEYKPYTCPVCNGEGSINLNFFINCVACKSQGIVWG